jgi:hypothetical protein
MKSKKLKNPRDTKGATKSPKGSKESKQSNSKLKDNVTDNIELPVQSESLGKGTSRKRVSKHYVDNVEFERLIREYYKTDIFSEELGVMIDKISQHVAYMPRFINYTYHESMISDSNYKMVKALNERKFNPDKGSAFSYFTKICIHAFYYVTEQERKKNLTIENYQTELYDELMLNGYSSTATDHENHYEE